MPLNLNKSFNYNKGQRRAIWLLVLIILFLIYWRFQNITSLPSKYNYSMIAQRIDSFINSTQTAESTTFAPKIEKKIEVKLRPFNPNTTSYETFLELGLTPRQARSILKYLSTGAQFVYKSDLKRIYTLDISDYQRLESFIILPEKSIIDEDEIDEKYNIPIEPLEINAASQSELLSISGVGPVISKNIIKYREMLGGYYSTEQLREVYGIDSNVFEKISPNFLISDDFISKQNINKMSYYDLRKHPYISNQQAFEITNHIKYQGAFKRLDELLNLESINDSVYEKIYHYFVVQ